MKKFLVLFLALSMAVTFTVAAQTGVTVGVEGGIGNVTEVNDAKMTPYVMPMFIFDRSFMNGALDLYAELDYTFGFEKEPNKDGDDVFPQSLYVDLLAGYNLGIGRASTLSFILENEFDEIIISPRSSDGNNITGIFTPAVKFTQGFGIGDVYARVGAPITYIQDNKDADLGAGLDFTLGWNSRFGLWLEATMHMLLAPSDDTGYTGLDASAYFDTGLINIGADVTVPSEVSDLGLTVTPKVTVSLGSLSVYAKCEFAGLGSDSDMILSPAVGITFSF